MDKHVRRTRPARCHENFPGLNFDGHTLREIRNKVRGRDEEPSYEDDGDDIERDGDGTTVGGD